MNARVWVTACVLLPLVFDARASADAPGEYEVKAAFLYQLSLYVEWPQGAVGEEFLIGVLGEDPFGVHLDEIAKTKTVSGKKIEVRRYKKVDDLKPCRILFVASSERKRLPAVVSRCEGWSVLLVADTPGSTQKGVAVNFYVEERRVRFEVSLKAASRAKLQVSPKLLRLARVVE